MERAAGLKSPTAMTPIMVAPGLDAVESKLIDLRSEIEQHVNAAASLVSEVERAARLRHDSQMQRARLRELVIKADALRNSAIAKRATLRTVRASIGTLRASIR